MLETFEPLSVYVSHLHPISLNFLQEIILY